MYHFLAVSKNCQQKKVSKMLQTVPSFSTVNMTSCYNYKKCRLQRRNESISNDLSTKSQCTTSLLNCEASRARPRSKNTQKTKHKEQVRDKHRQIK